MPRKIRTAVLISGRGSNMVALAKAAQAADYPAEIALVISNRPKAAGLQKAKELGIPALAIDHKQYATREAFEHALHAALIEAKIELVCCAGFMRVMTSWITALWPGKMLNIHPSLLPKYKGLHTHKRALENGDSVHGCTVHFVSEELDGGAVIAQAQIDVRDGDTADSLAAKLIPIEHSLYVQALQDVAAKLAQT
ncbi:MAG: phosphoribosylglycinamide formyltransferase [Alphaproteobacteria bacterium]